MEIRELELFIAVAESLNFRAAAEHLNMTQPPLTRAINRLENELQTKLFMRTTRKVELTPMGMALLSEAHKIIEKVQNCKEQIHHLAQLEGGELKLALSPHAIYSSGIKSIWDFKDKNPNFELNIIDAPKAECLKRLKQKDVDVVIVECFDKLESQYPYQLLEKIPLGILTSRKHRLAKLKRVRIEELDGETFIMHDSSTAKTFEQSFQKLLATKNANVQFHYRQKDENCCLLAANEKGLLLTTEQMSKFAMEGVHYVPIDHKSTKISLVAYWKEANPSLPLRSFTNYLKNQASIKIPSTPCLMSLANW